MQEYVVERSIPGAGKMTTDDLRAASRKSRDMLRELGPDIQWVHTYVTDDKMYCVYRAEDPDLIREHATRGGFPADIISPVRAVINPTTAN